MKSKTTIKVLMAVNNILSYEKELKVLSENSAAITLLSESTADKYSGYFCKIMKKPFSKERIKDIIQSEKIDLLLTDNVEAVSVFSAEENSSNKCFAALISSQNIVSGSGENFKQALKTALEKQEIIVKEEGGILFTVKDSDKVKAFAVADGFRSLNFEIFASKGTADFLNSKGMITISVKKLSEGSDQILKLLSAGRLSYVLNTPTDGSSPMSDGYIIREKAAELSLPCITELSVAEILLLTLKL